MRSKTNLEICKSTRKIAAQSLEKALRDLLKKNQPVSEVDLRNKWLEELRKYKTIFLDGWYSPPPHGIIVVFATDKDFSRMKHKTFRREESWPRNDIFLDKKNGFALLYCSPVDKQTGIIGDFGLNIYFGKNNSIKSFLKKDLLIIKEIFNLVKIDMKLADLYSIINNVLKKNKLLNEFWISTTDPIGINYGHTIPITNSSWTNKELIILKNGEKNWQETLTMISKKRKFVNECEETVIKPGMAITLEPKIIFKNYPEIPEIFFHTIILFKENGKKELLTNFDEIFRLIGMDYLF